MSKTKQAEYRAFYSHGFLRLYRHQIQNGVVQPGTLVRSTADPAMDGYTMEREEVSQRINSGEEGVA